VRISELPEHHHRRVFTLPRILVTLFALTVPAGILLGLFALPKQVPQVAGIMQAASAGMVLEPSWSSHIRVTDAVAAHLCRFGRDAGRRLCALEPRSRARSRWSQGTCQPLRWCKLDVDPRVRCFCSFAKFILLTSRI